MSSYSILFDLIGVLARRRYQIGERCFAPLGLNHTEARLLTLLNQEGGAAHQDGLSSMLTVDRTNAGRALNSLELKGYVTRRVDVKDKRTKTVHMAAAGREAVGQIAKLREKMAASFFGDLTETQAETAVDLLKNALESQRPMVHWHAPSSLVRQDGSGKANPGEDQ